MYYFVQCQILWPFAGRPQIKSDFLDLVLSFWFFSEESDPKNIWPFAGRPPIKPGDKICGGAVIGELGDQIMVGVFYMFHVPCCCCCCCWFSILSMSCSCITDIEGINDQIMAKQCFERSLCGSFYLFVWSNLFVYWFVCCCIFLCLFVVWLWLDCLSLADVRPTPSGVCGRGGPGV